jgi:hypothetical protein
MGQLLALTGRAAGSTQWIPLQSSLPAHRSGVALDFPVCLHSQTVVGQFDCGRLPGWKRGRAGRIFVGWQMPLARTCLK